MTTVYFVHHSHTPGDDTPNEKVWGWSGGQLDAKGKAIAQQTADWLKDKGVGETYSSDLQRAKETAQIIHDALGISHPNTERIGLRPMNLGTLSGQKKADVEGVISDLQARPWAKAPGGGSMQGFLHTFGKELNRDIQEAQGEDYQCVYVTHSHNFGVLPHLLSQGVVPAKLGSDIGPGAVVALHVNDGKVTMEPVFDPSGE